MKKLAKLRRSYQRANLKRKLHLGIKLNEKKTAEMKCCGVKLNKNAEQVRMGPSQVRQGFEKAYRVGRLLGK